MPREEGRVARVADPVHPMRAAGRRRGRDDGEDARRRGGYALRGADRDAGFSRRRLANLPRRDLWLPIRGASYLTTRQPQPWNSGEYVLIEAGDSAHGGEQIW